MKNGITFKISDIMILPPSSRINANKYFFLYLKIHERYETDFCREKVTLLK